MGRGGESYWKIFFAANGFGPYKCFFCEKDVSFEEVHIHHSDGDKLNNTIKNLVATHHKCHNKYHSSTRVLTEEHKRNISKGKMGHEVSEETRRKLSIARKKYWERKGRESL